MPPPKTLQPEFDLSVEQQALRDAGVLGRGGGGMGNALEFTVRTPGASDRGGRRIVARRSGVLFFTACHYERIQGPGSAAEKKTMTATVDPAWQNGFSVITGMSSALRSQLKTALAKM